MKSPHFFKANSRIGLTHPPVRQTEFNYGVEEGANAILTDDFLTEFPESEITGFIFSDPEKINPKNYVTILAEELASFRNLINQSMKNGQMQILLGGDNTVTFSSLLALIDRVEDVSKIGFIQFDSHGESNSFSGSISKNFHGMYMRPFFDEFDIEEIEKLVPKKLDPEQAYFVGDQVLDGDEPEFFEKNNWHSLTFKEYSLDKTKFRDQLIEFVDRFEYLHVNFDIDVFDRTVAGATGIPEDGKWMKDEIFELLEIIKKHRNLSFDLSEINPSREGAGRTISISQEILRTILS